MKYHLSPCDQAIIPQRIGTPDRPVFLRVQTVPGGAGSTVNEVPLIGESAFVPVWGQTPVLTLRDAGGQVTEQARLRFVPSLYHTFRFTVDDTFRFLEELTLCPQKYPHITDHPFMKGLYHLHELYGLKVTLNLFYSYWAGGFSLADVTDRYREEFESHADWLRFSFHARHNDPPYPYDDAPAQVIVQDFDEVTGQIRRFAGEHTLSDFMTVHCFRCTREACLALQERGVRGFMGAGGLSNGIPTFTGYLEGEDTAQMERISLWQDPETKLYFIRNDLILNLYPIGEIIPAMRARGAEASCMDGSEGTGYMDLMIHEQYFYPDYVDYQPDFMEKLDRAFGFLQSECYRSVFLDDVL